MSEVGERDDGGGIGCKLTMVGERTGPAKVHGRMS